MNTTLNAHETSSVAFYLEACLQNLVKNSDLVGADLVNALKNECPDAADDALLDAYLKLHAGAQLAVA